MAASYGSGLLTMSDQSHVRTGFKPLAKSVHAFAFAIASACSLAGLATAAPASGDMGLTSKSGISINLNIASRMDVSGLQNRSIEALDTVDPVIFSVCVTASTSTRAYSVTVFGPSDGTRFFTHSAHGRPIPLNLEWAMSPSPGPITRLFPGDRVAGLLAATVSCSPQTLVKLIVSSPDWQIPEPIELTMEDAITLVIAPD